MPSDRERTKPGQAHRRRFAFLTGICLSLPVLGTASRADTPNYSRDIHPILKEFCFDCHGEGMDKGKISLDTFRSDQERLADKELWLKAIKNVRAGLMPPEKKPRPNSTQQRLLESWITSAVFESDPTHPDPGAPSVRRLNRLEYRNTIRDLIGIDFNTEAEFPADDTGHGFDNIGSVLTLSPMLIEKYLEAARSIVEKAVPAASRVAPERRISGVQFHVGPPAASQPNGPPKKEGPAKPSPISLSYYKAATHSAEVPIDHAGRYQVSLELTATEKHVESQFDLNRCRITFRIDGREALTKDFIREGNRAFRFDFDQEWTQGEHRLTLELQPLTPTEKQVRSLSIRLDGVTLRGPLDKPALWVRPRNHEKFFGGDTPTGAKARRAKSREILGRFASSAYRRPVDEATLNRLADLAQSVSSAKGKTFEEGVRHAMVAILVSPRFLFREDYATALQPGEVYPQVDEYTLASRLSYFLWASMPDEELLRRAGEGRLRAEMSTQLKRMMSDRRSETFVTSFVGQWLQTRDIESIPIEVRAVMSREIEPDPEVEKARKRFRELREKEPERLTDAEKDELAKARDRFFKSSGRFSRYELTGDLRRAMRQETEKYFDYVLREDRSLLELIDSDYTFLNQKLAEHYGIEGVEGDSMRRVTLDAQSPRGGILTHGSVLVVTSNPTRTSPVKRGLFLLENILGTPTPPAPPNVPSLEENARKAGGGDRSLRDTLAMHREKPLCSSCHNRMDPLGLALENFNALGRWRDKEKSQKLDPAGRLITGEAFQDIRGLKKVLTRDRREDFYRCFVEKLLTFALGRGLEYFDMQTVDQLVGVLKTNGGKPAALLTGIVNSAPFQRVRKPETRPSQAALPQP